METKEIEAVIKLAKEIADLKYQKMSAELEKDKAIEENRELKKFVVHQNLDKYNIRKYSLEEVMDIDGYNYGLSNVTKLLTVLTKEEMNMYIAEEWEKQHKEETEEEEEE